MSLKVTDNLHGRLS